MDHPAARLPGCDPDAKAPEWGGLYEDGSPDRASRRPRVEHWQIYRQSA